MWLKAMPSACVIGQLVLADLQLVALLQAMRVDPRTVHVRAVQRAGVVDPVGGRHRLARESLAARQQRTAARAVVGALVAEKAALGAMQGHELAHPSNKPARPVSARAETRFSRRVDSRAGHG